MKMLDEIKSEYSSCRNIHFVNENEMLHAKYDVGRKTILKEGYYIFQTQEKFSTSVCFFHNKQMSALQFSNGSPSLYHFSDKTFSPFKTNYMEIRYILEGYLQVEINGETLSMQEGDLLIVSEDAIHRDLPSQSEGIVLNISCINDVFTPVFFEKIDTSPLKEFLRKSILFYNQDNKYIYLQSTSKSQSEEMQWYCYNFYREAKNQYPGYADICVGHLVRLFSLCITSYHFHFSKSDHALYLETLFHSVSEYMKENLISVKLKDLTEIFHHNPDFFNRLIKKHTGMTYSQYLIYLRMDRAKTLLITTDLSIETIVFQCGYNNKGFFFRKFKEYTGYYPKEYRLSTVIKNK